ncbi:DUF4124 domain-containing protein [Colwellia sp. D2M02]|uniref:DUF4124 domain-containing protein n=1 Tax=Colwellia sp. D2M02 TaxID=2841562 RepID=UPI001C09EB6C|nr:DUF4124 domain-containing protein [Colwellia sp. D2M02]MBU2892706.1 DUF4124 domain-containing protein [Colwellia sp. D2M02]
MIKLTLLPATLLCLSIGIMHNANAEIYTWVDENGKTHFSDRPFPENATKTTVKTITPKSHNSVAVENNKDSQWQKDYQLAQKKKAEKKEQEKLKKQENEDTCKELKRQLTIHNQNGRTYRLDDNGERNYLTSEQIDKEKAQLSKALKKHCR